METSQTKTTEEKAVTKPSRVFKLTREVAAAAIWIYALVKMFVLDIDVAVLDRWSPRARGILNYKAFIIVGTLALLWIVMRRRFLPSVGYVISYPLRVLFWYLPRVAFKRWTLLVVFAPAIYEGCRAFKRTFILYTVAAIAALLTLTTTRAWLLIPSVIILHTFIGTHLWRALRRGYTANLFDDLTKLAGYVRTWIDHGFLDGTAEAQQNLQRTPTAPNATAPKQEPSPTLLYGARHGAEYIADKTLEFAKSRKFDGALVASWCHTVVLTTMTYAFIYSGLYGLNPATFTVMHTAAFWRFVLLSLHVLRIGVIDSGLHPVGGTAVVSASSEMVAGILVIIILGFTVFRARREGLNHDVERFAGALRGIGGAVEQRIVDVWKMTMVECEIFLMEHGSGGTVNSLRTARGLRPLPLPSKPDAEAPRTPA